MGAAADRRTGAQSDNKQVEPARGGSFREGMTTGGGIGNGKRTAETHEHRETERNGCAGATADKRRICRRFSLYRQPCALRTRENRKARNIMETSKLT